MRHHLTWLVLALAAGAAAIVGAQSPSPVVAITNVNVVPMDREHVLSDHTVLVRDGRIASLGPASGVTVPEGATRVDGRGKWLIPASPRCTPTCRPAAPPSPTWSACWSSSC